MNVNDKMLASVLKLSAPDRYSHFVKSVVDWQCVWGLYDRDGWMLLGLDDGKETFPVWPAKRYAESYAEFDGRGMSREALPCRSSCKRSFPI